MLLLQVLKSEFEHKRFVWEMKEQLERPRVVSAKLIPLETKDNYFAQVVVRMHSSQVKETLYYLPLLPAVSHSLVPAPLLSLFRCWLCIMQQEN